jgi:hypothetical protein
LRDAPQHGNDFASIRFAGLNHHETFSGQDEASVSVQQRISDTESKRESAKPGNQKAEDPKRAYGPGEESKKCTQKSEYESNGKSGSSSFQISKSGMNISYRAVCLSLDHSRTPKTVFAKLAKSF